MPVFSRTKFTAYPTFSLTVLITLPTVSTTLVTVFTTFFTVFTTTFTTFLTTFTTFLTTFLTHLHTEEIAFPIHEKNPINLFLISLLIF